EEKSMKAFAPLLQGTEVKIAKRDEVYEF
ncbi:MAG: hypothetical protein ACI88H_002498, partial [Cocleimonas sp.]